MSPAGAAHSWDVSVAGAKPLAARQRELSQLLDVLRAAAAGRGRTMFVTGEVGAGKQALLDGLEASAATDPELAATFFTKGNCDHYRKGQVIFEPFTQMLPALLADDWRGRTADALRAVVKKTAPNRLASGPFADAVLGAVAKSARVAHKAHAEDGTKQLAPDRASVRSRVLRARASIRSRASSTAHPMPHKISFSGGASWS